MLEFNFSPFPEIKTERLLLRCIEKTDAPELLSLRSDDDVMQYIGREKMKTLEEAQVFIQKFRDSLNGNENIMWVISFREQPATMIGYIGYWRMKPEHYRAEVGYMLNSAYWNKGIMKEALQAVIQYGFNPMNLHSIEAHINPDNTASAAVLEKSGFIREAYFKEDFYFNGQFSNTAVYSLLAR